MDIVRELTDEEIGVEFWLKGKRSTIDGGTSEIQRSIIADGPLENR